MASLVMGLLCLAPSHSLAAVDPSSARNPADLVANFENGLNGWNLAGVGDVVPTVATDTAKEGSGSANVTLTGTQERSELILGGGGCRCFDQTQDFFEGDEGWYGFSFLIKQMQYGRPGAHNLIYQFHSDGTGSPPLGLMLWDYEGDDGVSGGRGLWSHGSAMGGGHFLAPLSHDRWYDVAIHYKASRTGDGFYEIYLDGNLVDSRDGVNTIRTDRTYNYMKNGLYRNGTEIPGTSEIRLDNARLGSSMAAVSSPDPDPVPAPAPEPPSLVANFEDGLNGWNLAGVGDVVPTVATDTAKEGSGSANVTLTGTQERSELILGGGGCRCFDQTQDFFEGDEGWYGFSFLIKQMQYGRPGAHNLIYQFHSDGTGSPPLGLMLWDYEGDDGVSGGRGLWSHGSAMGGGHFLAPLSHDRWYDIAIHYKASRTGDGFYEIYLDGNLVDSRDGVNTIRTDRTYNYMKNGLYRNGTEIPGTSELRLDNARLGSSLAAVSSPHPDPVPAPDPEPPSIVANFEQGLTGWNTVGAGDVAPTVVTDIVREGSGSAKVALNGTQERSELILGGDGTSGLRRGPALFDEGDEGYYGFSFLIRSMQYGRPGAHNLIMEFHSDGTLSPAFGLMLWDYEGDDGVSGGRGLWSHGSAMGGDRFLAPLEHNRWYDVVVHYRASRTGDGFYEVFLDGNMVDARGGVSMIRPDRSFAYIRTGLFRNGGEIPGPSELRLDNARLGTSMEQVSVP